MINKNEARLGSMMAKAFVVLVIISFGMQAFLVGDAVGYNEYYPVLSLVNFVLSFAFLFVIYVATKLFGEIGRAHV